MHLATDIILIWSAITGDSVRADIEDVNGPKSIKTKKDILEYLKSSFATGHKVISTLTIQNEWTWLTLDGESCQNLTLPFMP